MADMGELRVKMARASLLMMVVATTELPGNSVETLNLENLFRDH